MLAFARSPRSRSRVHRALRVVVGLAALSGALYGALWVVAARRHAAAVREIEADTGGLAAILAQFPVADADD